MTKKLGFNIDHIATLRNARQENYPDIIDLSIKAISYGADQITAHLREDRRHIQDIDLINIKKYVKSPLNMEMALTSEMVEIATQKVLPSSICLVPEKRNEITTEGGLDIVNLYDELEKSISTFRKFNIKTSLFVDTQEDQVKAVMDLKPDSIEINTGYYSNLSLDKQYSESLLIAKYAKKLSENNIFVHAGHGLNISNILYLRDINEIIEYNIGHFIVGYSLDVGLKKAISSIKNIITKT